MGQALTKHLIELANDKSKNVFISKEEFLAIWNKMEERTKAETMPGMHEFQEAYDRFADIRYKNKDDQKGIEFYFMQGYNFGFEQASLKKLKKEEDDDIPF